MKPIKEVCRKIANERNIMVLEKVNFPTRQFHMSDIMPEAEWITSGVTCFAARPGMGKTAFAIDLALDAALWMEKPIIYFSLESCEKQLVYRMLENIIGMRLSEELHAMDVSRMANAIGYLEKLNIFIDDTAGISILEIESELQKFSEAGMVVIDYVQLVTRNNKRFINGHDDIRWIVQNISRIAEERNIPVLMLSYLPRTVELRSNKCPCLEDMYGGIYASDVDQVIFLYREKVYKKNIHDNGAELIIAKSISGINQTIWMQFNEKHCRFEKDNRRNFDDLRRANLD